MAAEIRCPSCGKVNPADAEICRHCGARLSPAIPGGASGGAPSGGDEPDWLRALRDDEPQQGGSSDAGQPAEPAADVPDWLARIREKASEGEKPADGGLFADDDDVFTAGEAGSGAGQDAEPDWMKGLGGEESAMPAFDDADDWLSRLGGENEAPEKPAAPTEPAGQKDVNADLSNWLASLDQQDLPAGEAASSEQVEESAAEGLTGRSLFDDDEETPPSTRSDSPLTPVFQSDDVEPAASDDDDWLSKLDFDRDEGANAGQILPQPPPSQAPRWDASLWADAESGGLPEESSPAADDKPDWLRDFQSDAGAAGEVAGEEPSAQPAEPLPGSGASSGWGLTGWLNQRESASDQPDETTAAPIEDSASTEASSEIPSWLAETPSEPELPGQQDAVSGVPTWLVSVDDETASPESETEPAAGPAASSSEGLPSWLREGELGDDAAIAAPQSGPQAGDLPGWLASIDEDGQQEPAGAQNREDLPDFNFSPFSAPEEPAAVEPQQEAAAAQPAPTDAQPDWLASLKAAGEADALKAEEQLADAKKGTGPQPFIDEGLPDWMSEFQGQAPADTTTPPLVPVEDLSSTYTNKDEPFDIQLPAWLDEEAAQRSAEQQQEAEAGQPAGEELAQAELPSWVAAMRPVETALQGATPQVDSDQNVEKAGPLSGMRGVLPADETVISYRKPPVYSMKLRVTEKQRGHASLLENLIGQEAQPLVLPPVKSHAPQVVLRVLVALFLLVTLAGALMIRWQTPTPTLIPPNSIDMFDQVEALSADQTVLLAVDFEPGLAGEMRFASTTVLDHLMGRNTQIAVVSTVPSGPAMADSLLKQVQQNRPDYDLAGRVVNLGYLPGGTISLVEFARNPHGAAPQAVTGENAWDNPALAGIDDIQKFASVIVITDRAETGRDWVEQVQPYLGDVPLLFVTSAQAAPLLEPYIESRQAQGLVSGLMGGTLYGQQTGRQSVNPALGHYGAYQVGVLLAFVLVLIGAIVSSITAMVTRNKKNRE